MIEVDIFISANCKENIYFQLNSNLTNICLIPTNYTAPHNAIWDILNNKELMISSVIQDALNIN